MEMKGVKWVKKCDLMETKVIWAEMEGWKWMAEMMKAHFVHAE